MIPAVVLSAALLMAMILNLTLNPALSRKLTTVFMVISVIGGLIYYGAGMAETTGDLALTVIRAPVCVIRMFIGVSDLSAIEGSRLVSTQAGVFLFWLIHLLAFYSMASAAMFTLGAEAVRHLRFLLSRRGDLTLIYGINGNSIALGKECVAAGDRSVVYIDESADEDTVGSLNTAGMSVLTGADAVASDKKVIRKLRLRKRKLTVYALHAEADRNLFYALQLKDALETAGVSPERTRVTLPGAEDILMPMLQVSEKNYGFGHVNVFDSAELAARALILACPPWELMHFDRNGRSTDSFECVIAGFGRHGQAVLRELVMNGQFAGSTFRAAVFSPDVSGQLGYLSADCPDLMKNYDIQCFACDARSPAFFSYIGEQLQSLKMIVICTGDEKLNSEISNSVMLYLQRQHAGQVRVVQCGETGIRYEEQIGSPIVRKEIYTRELLSAEEADRLAILLNSTYDTSDRSDWEKWVSCDSFGKMSSRASADFFPAFIRASGSSTEEVLEGNWHPSEEQLQILGETEHLRWCAFHYAMGYTAMSREEFDANAAEYSRRKAEGAPLIKISKNAQERTHACLVPWEELDDLSERENRVTGKAVDYKQLDINNVLAMPRLLQAERNGREKKKA